MTPQTAVNVEKSAVLVKYVNPVHAQSAQALRIVTIGTPKLTYPMTPHIAANVETNVLTERYVNPVHVSQVLAIHVVKEIRLTLSKTPKTAVSAVVHVIAINSVLLDIVHQ